MLKKILLRIINYCFEFRQNCIYLNFRKKYNLHANFRFNGNEILMYGEGKIIAGENSYVGEYSTWQAAKGFKIEIGDGCQISHNVRCYTQTNFADADFSQKPIPVKIVI